MRKRIQAKNGKFQVVILVYGDNLVISSSMKDGVYCVRDKLRFLFNLTDLELVKHYHGVTFEQKRYVIILYRAGYCRRMLDNFRVVKAKSAPTPMDGNMDNLL